VRGSNRSTQRYRKEDHNEHPAPFTKITNSEVVSGVWVYGDGSEAMRHWANTYTLLLQARGKFLTIWPEHCIIGSPGHSVVPTINDALQRWACRSGRPIHYVMKGQNLRVEMYSALQAEVHDPLDLNTGLNVELLSMLKTSDKVRPK
jgi:nicotinamidase/pyrazinamidase